MALSVIAFLLGRLFDSVSRTSATATAPFGMTPRLCSAQSQLLKGLQP